MYIFSGKFECFVSGAVISNTETRTIFLNVQPLPQVKLTADNQNIESGKNASLNCTIGNKVSANITFLVKKGIYSFPSGVAPGSVVANLLACDIE